MSGCVKLQSILRKQRACQGKLQTLQLTKYPRNMVQTLVSYLYTGIMEKPQDDQNELFEQLLDEYDLMPHYTANPKVLEKICKVYEVKDPQKVHFTSHDYGVANKIKQEFDTEHTTNNGRIAVVKLYNDSHRDIGDYEIKKEEDHTMNDVAESDHGNAADDVNDSTNVGLKRERKVNLNLDHQNQVETEIKTELNSSEMEEDVEAGNTIDNDSISDHDNAADEYTYNDMKNSDGEHGETGDDRTKQMVKHTVVVNPKCERDNNNDLDNDSKDENKSIDSVVDKNEEWNIDDQEWMLGMEDKFKKWRETHSCDLCDKGWPDFTKYMDHFYETEGLEDKPRGRGKRRTEKKAFPCNVCGIIFQHKSRFVLHMRKHTAQIASPYGAHTGFVRASPDCPFLAQTGICTGF